MHAGNVACALSTGKATAGTLRFDVINTGAAVTDFSVYREEDQLVGAVGNVGPGATRRLVVEVPEGGIYTTVCKLGTVGDSDGFRTLLAVTGSETRSTDSPAQMAAATAEYKRYAAAQARTLVPRTQEFVDAVKARNVDRAKVLYPVARTYWERLEPVVESLGDIDSKVDGREDEERAPGARFTGFHRLEKDLWMDGLQADSPAIADQLLADVKDLQTRVARAEPTPAQLADGAKELLDEVALVKLAGEEDPYSHTALWDGTANVEGTQAVIAALRPTIDEKDPTLGPALDEQFGDMSVVADGQRVEGGYRSYLDLSSYDVQKMTVAVDALAESADQVSHAVAT